MPQPPSPSGTRWAQGRTGGTEPALGSQQAGKGAEKPAAGGAPGRRVADLLPVSTGHPAGASSGGALFLLVPQSEAHTLAHIHTHAHALTHVLTHTHTCSHMLTHSCMLAHTQTHAHAHSHTHMHTLMHACTHLNMLTHTCTHTLMHTHMHTHTHLHTHAHTLIHTHTYSLTLPQEARWEAVGGRES